MPTKVKIYKTVKSTIDKQSSLVDGLYFTTDTHELIVSVDSEKFNVTDIEILKTESNRTSLLAPLTKFYYVLENNTLWYYNGSSWKSSVNIINNLTSTDASAVLSAAMGKKLNDEKLGKTESASSVKGALTLTRGSTTMTYNGSENKSFSIPDTPKDVGVIDIAPTSGQVAVFDGTTGKIKSTGFTLLKSVPADAKFTDTVYTHPTTAGNKHIPSGGSANQILRWSADGTAVWGAEKTYSTGNASTAGITKLYTGTGNATDGTLTQKAITDALSGKAPTNHSHAWSNITGKPDILGAMIMYGGTTLSSEATTADSNAQYTTLVKSLSSAATIFSKDITLPKGLYSIIVRVKLSAITGTNVLTLAGNSTHKNITASMIGTANTYKTLGMVVENTTGTLKVVLSTPGSVSANVSVDYLAIAPAMVGITSLA